MTSAEAVNWAMGEILKTPAKTPALEPVKQSDTPRTDKQILFMPVLREGKHVLVEVVQIDFARQLERELYTLEQINARNLERALEQVGRAKKAERELAEYKQKYLLLSAQHVREVEAFRGEDGELPSAAPDRNAIIEECAKVCLSVWRDEPQPIRQNMFSHGCVYAAKAIRALKESAAPQAGRTVEPNDRAAGEQSNRRASQVSVPDTEPAVAAPKLSEARRLENAIVAAKLDAFEAADMLGAIIASLLARYGDEHEAFYDIKNYSTKMEAAIMDLDK